MLTHIVTNDIICLYQRLLTNGKEVIRVIEPREIGERLTALRGNRAREEVATAVGVSRSAIAMYEQGERIPRDDIKIRIARYYQRTVQEIFFDPECHIE